MLSIVLLFLIILHWTNPEYIKIGYLTGSDRRPGDKEYSRPGRTINGAITLAVDEVNHGILKDTGYQLSFIVAETYGEESTSIKETANLWTQNISVYIGPQETCEHEAAMAAAFNLPMISYVSIIYCFYHINTFI